MVASITIETIFEKEPYKSIITLLIEYRDGLNLKHIQYAIMKPHFLNSIVERNVEKDLGEKYKDLLENKKIKKYTSDKAKFAVKSKINRSENAEKVRKNLYKFLNNMLTNPDRILSRYRGKYIVNDQIVKQLYAKNDIKIIEHLSKQNVKNYENGRVNLYGNLPNEFEYLDHNQKKSNDRPKIEGKKTECADEDILKAIEKLAKETEIKQKKFEKAINKIREGMDELQKLTNPPLGWSISEDKSLNCITDERYPLIDRQLLIIFRAYTFTFSNEMYGKLYEWFYSNSDGFYVVHADDELVNVFRKYFYPSTNVKEIREMLDNHVIDDDISWDGFDYVWDLYFDIEAYSHMVAVVHSSSGITMDEDIKKKLIENLPLTSDEMHKLIFELSKSSEEFLYNYYKSTDRNLMSRIMRSRITEKIKNKAVEVDDFINFDNSLLN